MTLLEIIQNEKFMAARAFSGDEKAAEELIRLGAVTKMNDPEKQDMVFRGFVDGVDRVLYLIKQNPPEKSKPKQKLELDISI